MRADRLLSILLLLQTGKRRTSRELAERLEVSERTIHRDMEALIGTGVPVVAERGSGGGWSLSEPYQTRLNGLRPEEIRTLFLGQSDRVLSDLGFRQPYEAALLKLLAALPAGQRRDAEFMRERIHVDGAGWHEAEESLPALAALQDALWAERRVTLLYDRGDAGQVERVVDPLGLVVKKSVWYLVAAVEGAIRTYRVSRVREARLAEEPAARPEGFCLAAYWSESTRTFKEQLPRYPVVLRVRAEALPRLRNAGRYARIQHEEPPGEDGWATVSVVYDTEDEACEFVLGYADSVLILEPRSLRARVRALAEEVVRLYTEQA